MEQRVRAAIVGTGGIARVHAEAAAGMKDRMDLVACMDVDSERAQSFADEHDIPARYTDFAKMLRKEKPGLVIICTPPAAHCDLIVKSLRAGAWVFCEKPLCGSMKELDRIEKAEAESGAYCASVLQWRFGSAAQHAKKLIYAGVLGRPLLGVCRTTWYRDQAYYDVPWRGTWESELGGVSMGLGIHAMDLLLWLLGDWREIIAVVDTLDRDIEVEDVSLGILRLENGALVSLVNSALSPREETYLRMDFQKASLEVRDVLYGYSNNNWIFTPAAGPDQESLRQAWSSLERDSPSSHAAQLESFMDSMQRNERPPTSGWEARRALELITGMYKSAATGKPVRRDSLTSSGAFYRHTYGTLPAKLR